MGIWGAILTFIGLWLLYIFPLYQGVLEISEQDKIIGKLSQADEQKYPEISSWYWLIPPLKIRKEKERGIAILRDSLNGKEDIHALFGFLNKATAWFYISLAGILNAIVATYDLVDSITKSYTLLISFIVDILMIIIGVLVVIYRSNRHRKQRILDKIWEK